MGGLAAGQPCLTAAGRANLPNVARHEEPARKQPGSEPSAREIAGWVAFLVPVSVVLLLWTGAGWPAAALVGGLGVICGAVLWWVGGGAVRRTGRDGDA